jgi:hypothetical protein
VKDYFRQLFRETLLGIFKGAETIEVKPETFFEICYDLKNEWPALHSTVYIYQLDWSGPGDPLGDHRYTARFDRAIAIEDVQALGPGLYKLVISQAPPEKQSRVVCQTKFRVLEP